MVVGKRVVNVYKGKEAVINIKFFVSQFPIG